MQVGFEKRDWKVIHHPKIPKPSKPINGYSRKVSAYNFPDSWIQWGKIASSGRKFPYGHKQRVKKGFPSFAIALQRIFLFQFNFIQCSLSLMQMSMSSIMGLSKWNGRTQERGRDCSTFRLHLIRLSICPSFHIAFFFELILIFELGNGTGEMSLNRRSLSMSHIMCGNRAYRGIMLH